MKGILLTDDGDLTIKPSVGRDGKLSGLVIGDTLVQVAGLVITLNQGEVKEDPLIGPNLLRFIRGKSAVSVIKKQVRIHLDRAGVDYELIKDGLKMNLNTD